MSDYRLDGTAGGQAVGRIRQEGKVFNTPFEAFSALPLVAQNLAMIELLLNLHYPIYPLIWDETKLE